MKSIVTLVAALIVGGAVLPMSAQAAGCVSGAAVGGVAGHMAGHHGLLGAAAGCAVGHHASNKQNAAANANSSQQAPAK